MFLGGQPRPQPKEWFNMRLKNWRVELSKFFQNSTIYEGKIEKNTVQYKKSKKNSYVLPEDNKLRQMPVSVNINAQVVTVQEMC